MQINKQPKHVVGVEKVEDLVEADILHRLKLMEKPKQLILQIRDQVILASMQFKIDLLPLCTDLLSDRLKGCLAEFVILLQDCRSLVVDRPKVFDQCGCEELRRVKQLLLLHRLHLVRFLEVSQVFRIFLSCDFERCIQLFSVHFLMQLWVLSLTRETGLLLVALQHTI